MSSNTLIAPALAGHGPAPAGLTSEDGLDICFQRADGYQVPDWPGQGGHPFCLARNP